MRSHRIYLILWRLVLRKTPQCSSHAPFWGPDATCKNEPIQALRVAVHGLSKAGVRQIVQRCRASGLALGTPPDLVVVVVDDLLHPGLVPFNDEAYSKGRTWMLVQPIGRIVVVGPMFTRGTACWECLAQRVRSNRWAQIPNLSNSIEENARRGPSISDIAINIVVTEIIRWAALNRHSPLHHSLLTINSANMSVRCHAVVKRPQCPVCGNPKRARTPLRHIKAAYTGEFQENLDKTLVQLRRHISPVTGIVREPRCDRVDTNKGPIFISSAAHVFGSSRLVRPRTAAIAVGKGSTFAEATVGCLAEAVERYSVSYHGDEPMIRKTHYSLGHRAILPEALMQFSGGQYERRAVWNSGHSAAFRVSDPFVESADIEWTAAVSLSHECTKYLPSQFCYLGYPSKTGQRFCLADSSGCASAANLGAAIVAGFLELIERDAVAIWWYNRVRRPEVVLDLYVDELVGRAAAFLTEQARQFWMLNLTSDSGIPVCAALSAKNGVEILYGFGCGFTMRHAQRRAVAELMQVVALLESWRFSSKNAPERAAWLSGAHLSGLEYLIPDPAATAPTCIPEPTNGHMALECCMRIAGNLGLELLVVDTTRPDLAVPCVRVIVPGLRHIWNRLAPGRLYEVPVKLNWLSRPLTEKEMNPHVCWL